MSTCHSALASASTVGPHNPLCSPSRCRALTCSVWGGAVGDFPVIATGRQASAQATPVMHDYVQLLQADIRLQPAGHGPLETVFFGGGTPSLVPPGLLEQVLQTLQTRFGISASAEVSMEADPGPARHSALTGPAAACARRRPGRHL